jgi:hypothetical protein
MTGSSCTDAPIVYVRNGADEKGTISYRALP